MVETNELPLVCSECTAPADEAALGWRAYLADLDDDGFDELVHFCRVCAEREFGSVRCDASPGEPGSA